MTLTRRVHASNEGALIRLLMTVINFLIILLIPFSFLGFVLIPGVGEIAGLTLGLVLICFFLFFGEKIILMLSGALPLKDKPLIKQMVANKTCLIEMSPVEIYITHKHPCNIYFVGTKKSSSIIIGRNLFNKLSASEMESVLFCGILKIKSLDVFYSTINTLGFSIFLLPIFFLRKLESSRFLGLSFLFKIMSDIVTYFYLPSLIWNYYIMKRLVNNANLFEKLHHELGHDGSFSSAIFKIEKFRKEVTLRNSLFILNYLSVAPYITLGVMRGMNYIYNAPGEGRKSRSILK